MRIIGGLAKGRKLKAPKTFLVRPVSDKVKEAIFNILGPLDNDVVLDLFAGSGSVGLEALSRGAGFALFIDSLALSSACIRGNIELCGFSDKARIMKGVLPSILNRLKKNNAPFDLVFIDPPYDKNLINKNLEALANNKLVDARSRIVIEHSPREKPFCDGMLIVDQRQYGQTFVSFLKYEGF